MKQSDISQSVMKKVAVLERSSIRTWGIRFLSLVLLLVLGFSISFAIVIQSLLDQKSFAVFELFLQDPEIIREFWRDALLQFSDELPQTLAIVSVLFIMCTILLLNYTRKKRSVIRKKISQLDKYS